MKLKVGQQVQLRNGDKGQISAISGRDIYVQCAGGTYLCRKNEIQEVL